VNSYQEPVTARASPFPSLAGAPPHTRSMVSFRLPAELAHACCRQQAYRSNNPRHAPHTAHRSLRPRRVPERHPQCFAQERCTGAA